MLAIAWSTRSRARPLTHALAPRSASPVAVASPCRRRKTQAFLLPVGTKDEIVDRLFDRRALHILSRSISAAHRPDERFIVYKLDYGCYVDLVNTDKFPNRGLLRDDPNLLAIDFDVPEDDRRSYRRAILNLKEFYEVVGSGAVHQGRDGPPTVWANFIATRLVNQVHNLLGAFRVGQVDPPFSLQFALGDVRGAIFAVEDRISLRAIQAPLLVERDPLAFVDSVIPKDVESRDDVATALKPMLDQLFQTAGLSGSPWFNKDGTLRPCP